MPTVAEAIVGTLARLGIPRISFDHYGILAYCSPVVPEHAHYDLAGTAGPKGPDHAPTG